MKEVFTLLGFIWVCILICNFLSNTEAKCKADANFRKKHDAVSAPILTIFFGIGALGIVMAIVATIWLTLKALFS